MIFRILRRLALAIAYFAGIILALWAAGALYFDLPAPVAFRLGAAVIWLAGAAVAWWVLRPRRRARFGVALCFVAILVWWCTLRPRQDRNWKPDVAVLSHATIEGDRLTVHHVRNFDYRAATEFTPRFESRNYDLNALKGLDVIVSKWKWSSGILGHPILSFDFGTGGHLAFTIEIRPEKNESFSLLRALYRQFELIYIPADERDIIGMRAAFRPGEDLYLYRVMATPTRLRETLMEYVARLNQLRRRPEWYNLITANCTSSIRTQRTAGKRLPWDIRILLNGYVDEMLYERGALDRSLPFAELERRSRINENTREAYGVPNFSERLRAGLPGFP